MAPRTAARAVPEHLQKTRSALATMQSVRDDLESAL